MNLIDMSVAYQRFGVRSAWHLVYYIPKGKGPDDISDQILAFKKADLVEVVKWSVFSGLAFSLSGLSFDLVTRALGSQELEADSAARPVPLDTVASIIARNTGAEVIEGLICKRRTTRKLSSMHSSQWRASELQGVFCIDADCELPDHTRLLIVDDVTTSGTTVGSMAQALLAQFPTLELSFFALAKTANDASLNEGLVA